MNDRYKGKPLLILIEKYILEVIGQLKEADRANLEKITPNLQQTFKQQGIWSEIVAAEMEFTSQDAESIVKDWEQNRKRVESQGKSIDAETFARFLADHLVGSDSHNSGA